MQSAVIRYEKRKRETYALRAKCSTMKMRKGNSYRLSMRWLNCDGHDDVMSPWYCWQALKLKGYIDGDSTAVGSEGKLDVEISSVEDMYRYVTLRGAHNKPSFLAIWLLAKHYDWDLPSINISYAVTGILLGQLVFGLINSCLILAPTTSILKM